MKELLEKRLSDYSEKMKVLVDEYNELISTQQDVIKRLEVKKQEILANKSKLDEVKELIKEFDKPEQKQVPKKK